MKSSIQILALTALQLMFIHSFAQDWQYYDSSSVQNQLNNEWDAAIENAEKALQLVEEKFGVNDTTYANACYVLGLIYRKIGDYKLAKEYYSKTKVIRENLLGKENHSYAEICNGLALLN